MSKKLAGIIILIVIVALWLFFANKNQPLAYSAMKKQAEIYATQGKIAFAIEEYNKILEFYPNKTEIYLDLANLYKKINQNDKAKVQYIMAIRRGGRDNVQVYIELAKIYCSENSFDIAEDIIKDIKSTNNNKIQDQIGDLYYEWGEHVKEYDSLEAIRKFREARVFYQKAGSRSQEKALSQIITLYGDASDDLIAVKNTADAVDLLKISLNYADNALAHYKLAKIYENQNKNKLALKEYSKAYNLDKEASYKTGYVNLMMKMAQEYRKKGDKVYSDYLYETVKKVDSRVRVPKNPDSRILFTLISTRLNEDMEQDIFVPGIQFKIVNISKEKIEDLKVKVVFMVDGKEYSSRITTIAEPKEPIKADSESEMRGLYSNTPVKHIFDDHNINVLVYISQQTPDSWKLFRNIPIKRERKPVTLKE